MRQSVAKQNPKATNYGQSSGVRSLNPAPPSRPCSYLERRSQRQHGSISSHSCFPFVVRWPWRGGAVLQAVVGLSPAGNHLRRRSIYADAWFPRLAHQRSWYYLWAYCWVDRWPRAGFRKMLLAALALGAGISLLEAAIPPLPAMLALRLLEGASHLIIVVAAPTLIAQITATRFLPVAMTLWSTFFGVAYALTAWFGEPLVATHGVPSIFYVHAAWMLAITALLFVALPRDAPQETSRITNVLRQHLTIYSNPRHRGPQRLLGFVTR